MLFHPNYTTEKNPKNLNKQKSNANFFIVTGLFSVEFGLNYNNDCFLITDFLSFYPAFIISFSSLPKDYMLHSALKVNLSATKHKATVQIK